MSATIDDIATAIRYLIRRAMGMPDNSVRPSGQSAPAGSQVAEMAIVEITDAEDVGFAADGVEPDGSGGFLATSEVPERITASVNFFKSPTRDAAGLATYSNAAYDRARRLNQVLQLPANVQLTAILGLGYLGAGKPHNLRALADQTWESRGHVDLYFNVINRETSPVATIASLEFTVSQQPSGASQTTEVTT